jgi:hypothetical protein
VGDLLYFDSTVSVPPGQDSSISMIAAVSNISTLAITVESPSPTLIQTSETHTVKEWTPLYAPGLSNLTIDLGTATGLVRRGVLVQDVRDGVFEHLEILNSSEAAFYTVRGYRNYYSDINLRNSGSGNESDFTASFETLSHFSDIQSVNATGFGPQWIACSYCFGSGVMSAGATGRGIKLHGVLQSTFANLTGLNSTSTGIAITLRTQHNNFTNLVAMGNAASSGNDIGLWFSGQENNGNYCSGVKLTINGDYDIQINPTDTHNVILDAQFDSFAKISNSGGPTNFIIGRPTRTGF